MKLIPPNKQSKVMQALICGMLGDAYGYPVEFKTFEKIRENTPEPERFFNAQTKIIVSDDSQMTLFTLQGVIDYLHQSKIASFVIAYKEWYKTQKQIQPDANANGMLYFRELYKRQAPGNTCMDALRANTLGTIEVPINDSKGCGGVMRTLPLNLLDLNEHDLWKLSCETTAITHGHPDGYQSSAVLNNLIWHFLHHPEKSFEENVTNSIEHYLLQQRQEGQLALYLESILESAQNTEETLLMGDHLNEKFGDGWTGDSAIAIGLHCALKSQSWNELFISSTWHRGDSDSTASIAAQIFAFRKTPEDFMVNNIYKIDVLKVFDYLKTKLPSLPN